MKKADAFVAALAYARRNVDTIQRHHGCTRPEAERLVIEHALTLYGDLGPTHARRLRSELRRARPTK